MNGLCVDDTDVCDGTDQCGDGSDENIQLCLEKRIKSNLSVITK